LLRIAAFVGSGVLRVLGLAILFSGLVGFYYKENNIGFYLLVLSIIYSIIGFLGNK